MIKSAITTFLSILLIPNAYSDVLCKADERVSFSCSTQTKSVSVCRNSDENLIYRFGSQQKIELELESDTHFSRTAYSGGGEGHLTFQNGSYSYVVYSSISNGDWLEDGTREKIERAGVYVVKDDDLLADVQCKSYSGKSFIHDLPAHDEEEYRYYE